MDLNFSAKVIKKIQIGITSGITLVSQDCRYLRLFTLICTQLKILETLINKGK